MKEELYLEHLHCDSPEEVLTLFHNTIIDTNRSFGFFVDWDKVKQHVDTYKIELNILNSLIGSKSFEDDLRRILSKYADVLPTIPILIALRDSHVKVIRDFMDHQQDYAEFDFSPRTLTPKELDGFVEFFQKTGLTRFFETMSSKSIQDYVTGVEVGMDTHARKNRSGDAMEFAIKPIIDQVLSEHPNDFVCLFQKKFKDLADFGVPVPTPLKARKADFILVKQGTKVINIEVNFYSGTGSKPQEIVDSYINRQTELDAYGFHFVWVTDGYGWQGQKNQIAKGFERVNYLLNLHFCRGGLLGKVLWHI